MLRILRDRLDSLHFQSSYRSLRPRRGVDFCSNDYLGFSQDPLLKKKICSEVGGYDLGSTGSRLLRGQSEVFEETEALLAQFCGRETALIFPSGYQANLGLLTSLLSSEDTVFSDRLNHASLIDGILLSRAKKEIYSHHDLKSLEEKLKKTPQSRLRVIVTESLFGMDGEFAPLKELADLAETYRALLIVDEAHATGIWGNLGGGRVQDLGLQGRVFASVHTAGKSMGVSGAWICGDLFLKEYLVNFSRAFIFSTAPSPWLALSLKSAVLHWNQVGKVRAHELIAKTKLFRSQVRTLGEGPIIPVLVGENKKALEMSEKLFSKGFDVRAIRPPTVPEGTARLRITLHTFNTDQEIIDLASILSQETI